MKKIKKEELKTKPVKKKKTTQRRKEKKKSKVKSCGYEFLYVCLIKKMSLSYESWKLKIAKMCFQFP